MSKNPKNWRKLMIIASIDKEILRNFNEIFRKDVPYDNIKSHKKPGFHSLFRTYIFRKTTLGFKLTPPPSVLGLNCLKCVLFFKYTHALLSKLYSVFIALGTKYFLRKIQQKYEKNKWTGVFFFFDFATPHILKLKIWVLSLEWWCFDIKKK